MIIEVTLRFTAEHKHVIPPGIMSASHPHDWSWTVWISDGLHPEYGWVADFNEIRRLMIKCTATHYEGTAEQIQAGLVHELVWHLPADGPTVVQSRLAETDDQAAYYIAGQDLAGFGPLLRTREPNALA